MYRSTSDRPSLTKVASADFKGSYSISKRGALSFAPIGSPNAPPLVMLGVPLSFEFVFPLWLGIVFDESWHCVCKHLYIYCLFNYLII